MKLLRNNVKTSAGYVPGEQPIDPRVIKLNTNENPYPPSPRVLEAIRAVTAEQLRRYPSPSGQAFREAAARLHNVTPDHILTFNGGDELLSVAIRAAADENDTVAFFEPSYSLYPVLTQIHGARANILSYNIDGTRWSLPANVENTDAAIMLIVNPNAPSGHLEPVEKLAAIAASFRGLLVIDEAYVDFAPQSSLDLVRQFPNVLILRTMSKGYSLAGLRFGYAIAQPQLLREIEKVRDSYPVDAIAIAAATAAITDQPYARDTWQKVKTERARMTAELQKLGFTMPESHSNFVLATAPQKRDAKSIYETLKARGILVRWWQLPRIADKVRITIGTPEQNNRLLAELATLV